MAMQIQQDVPLSEHTTIGLGGNARYFVMCRSMEELVEAIQFGRSHNLPLQIIGAGSNIIFPDHGFGGLIVKMGLGGISIDERGNSAVITVQAGENWDPFVASCIDHGYGGIECLSGIPGLVGATPVQNVGAYGQEVKETIVHVTALDTGNLRVTEFSNPECHFTYRQSRFKSADAGRYIIVSVTFRLERNATPKVRYAELRNSLEALPHFRTLGTGTPALAAVRSAVLALRRRKSMVLDGNDPNTRSVGSFFTNPILTGQQFGELENLWKRAGKRDAIPTFSAEGGVKVPAAWLVEKAGFHKGFRRGAVGISANHSLALVNHGGTTTELLELATEIQAAVLSQFGVRLEREPVVME